MRPVLGHQIAENNFAADCDAVLGANLLVKPSPSFARLVRLTMSLWREQKVSPLRLSPLLRAALPSPEDFSSALLFFRRAQAFSFFALEPFVQPLFDYHPRPLGASRKKSFPPVLIGFFKEGPHHLFP
jgi:hypothetical protein